MSESVYQMTDEEETEGAVTVTIWALDGQTVAEVDWPWVSDGVTIQGPALGNALPVPSALQIAHHARDKQGLGAILVNISDRALWQDAWGTLLPAKPFDLQSKPMR
jgi:hypothetical protein